MRDKGRKRGGGRVQGETEIAGGRESKRGGSLIHFNELPV